MAIKQESDLLKLNRALQEFQRNAKDIDDVERSQLNLLEEGSRIHCHSTDRETSRDR